MAKLAPKRGIRMMPRDITGPDDLERRAGSGSTTSRTSGGTRTTRTGTPRTSTNTSASSRRTSPGKRNTVKKQTEKRLETWRMFEGYGPNGGRKGSQALDGIFKAGKILSPKQARNNKAVIKEIKASKTRRNEVLRSKSFTPKQMKDARVAARKAK